MNLTDEQIAEIAPSWATHYYYHLDYIAFVSDEVFCKYRFNRFSEASKMVCSISDLGGIEIKRKQFDITEHEFSDIYNDTEKVDPSILDVKFWLADREDLTLNKKDAIALAKHFKLTEDDLK